MGFGLSFPISSKALYRKGNKYLRLGAASMHGWRETMEDAHAIQLSLPNHPEAAFLGIFDGHSGHQCAKYIADNLHTKIDQIENLEDVEKLREVVMETDQDFLDHEKYTNHDDGSAGIFTLIVPKDSKFRLVNANIGDSRTVLAQKSVQGFNAIACTYDHKPTNDLEKKRIESAGGNVQQSRVDGTLALSRAFGDRGLKQPLSLPPAERKVTSNPEIIINEASTGDFLFMACDGIYEGDVFTRESVISFIAEALQKTDDLAQICASVLDECLSRGSRDNMSAMIIQFVDGTSYHKEDLEYIPGPYRSEDAKFADAYAKDAQSYGFTLEQALEKRRQMDQAMEEQKKMLEEALMQ